MPIIPLLGLLFIGLKLTGHIDWSWGWVLAPLWLGLLVVFVIMMVFGLGAAMIGVRGRRSRSRFGRL